MSDEPAGPWALAIGVGLVGAAAVALEARRQLRARRGRDGDGRSGGGRGNDDRSDGDRTPEGRTG